MPSATRSRRGGASLALDWEAATPAPVVLLRGSEQVLADRAVARVLGLLRDVDPGTDVARLDAAACRGGELAGACSPSLFGETRCVVVEEVHSASDPFLADALDYLSNPEPDAVVILRHGGGQRGKKLLDAIAGAGHPVISCDPLRRDSEKSDFVLAEMRRARRRIEPEAVRAVLDAVGNDLGELAAACAQLVADTSGTVTADVVHRYHGGRVEATGFAVADAAVAGRGPEAIRLLRHALSTGVDPVPLVAALAVKLRTLAKVGAARGRGLDPARDLGLAPWQVDRARRELRGWTPEGLAAAIAAVAAADAEVKGAARDPQFAVERAVLRVAAAHG